MITQTINSKSKLADYKNYYKQAKQELEELRELQNNKVLTLQDNRQAINRRLIGKSRKRFVITYSSN